MNENVETSAISKSLLNRNVCSVCFTELESVDNFHGALYELRKHFFTGGKRSAHIKKTCEYMGYTSKADGTIHAHSLRWKMIVNKVPMEEAFYTGKSVVVVLRNLNSNICGKIHFDKDMRWIKTEYFSASDYTRATTILKPSESFDSVERFTYNNDRKNYDSEILFPISYEHGSAKQSLINSTFGNNFVLVSTENEDFCYCPKEEQEKRIEAFDTTNDDNEASLPIWEHEILKVADESLTEEPVPSDDPLEIDFESLTEEPVPSDDPFEIDSEELTEEPVASDDPFEIDSEELIEEPVIEKIDIENFDIEEITIEKPLPEEASLTEDDLILTIENESNAETGHDLVEIHNIISNGLQYNYTGKLTMNLREGRGRTNQLNGLTVFDGEYKNGLKHGHGAYYYADGNLSYVGSWKNNKRDGVGISFREKDHAMHVSTWKNGEPGEITTLFDPNGTLKYSGKLVDGKKVGFGFSYRTEDNSVFVGKYTNNDLPSEGSLFDADGSLLYTGHWKNGKRNGIGTEFEKNGQIVYSGEWKNDKYLNGVLYKKIEEK